MLGQPLSAGRVAELNEINCQPFQSRNNSAVIASVVALQHLPSQRGWCIYGGMTRLRTNKRWDWLGWIKVTRRGAELRSATSAENSY
jgi:hypothetical protein